MAEYSNCFGSLVLDSGVWGSRFAGYPTNLCMVGNDCIAGCADVFVLEACKPDPTLNSFSSGPTDPLWFREANRREVQAALRPAPSEDPGGLQGYKR